MKCLSLWCAMQCLRQRFARLDKVVFAPDVTLMAADYLADVLGQSMLGVKEKLEENEQSIALETDVWVGGKQVIPIAVVVEQWAVRLGRGPRDLFQRSFAGAVPGYTDAGRVALWMQMYDVSL